jgi:hypothetical protein
MAHSDDGGKGHGFDDMAAAEGEEEEFLDQE